MTGALARAGILLALLLAAPLAAAQQEGQQQAPVRAIEQLAGNLYRFQSGDRYGVFLVTDEGVILADPLGTSTATWLKQELQQRFGQQVKYVLYSHDHWQHVGGAEVFEGATIVAHANAVPRIAASSQPIAAPDLTFSSELRLTLGGLSVHLYYLGVSHTDNLVFMVFPEERALFAVDSVGIERLPFRGFPDTDVDGLIGALSALEQMDVDVVAPGHGAEVGTLADVRAHREYIESLKDQVTELLRAGNSDAAIRRAVTMADYRDWAFYDEWLDDNVTGMLAYVKSHYRF